MLVFSSWDSILKIFLSSFPQISSLQLLWILNTIQGIFSDVNFSFQPSLLKRFPSSSQIYYLLKWIPNTIQGIFSLVLVFFSEHSILKRFLRQVKFITFKSESQTLYKEFSVLCLLRVLRTCRVGLPCPRDHRLPRGDWCTTLPRHSISSTLNILISKNCFVVYIKKVM